MRRLKASKGLYRHWQKTDSVNLLNAGDPALMKVLDHSEERAIPPNSVWTFNVSPDTVYGEGKDVEFDSSAILTVAEKFEDWKLKVINVPVMNKR
jgi:hypothetical protein